MDPFNEYKDGEIFDALMAVELKNAIQRGLGNNSTSLFNNKQTLILLQFF